MITIIIIVYWDIIEVLVISKCMCLVSFYNMYNNDSANVY